MRIKKHVAFTLSSLLIAVGAGTVGVKAYALPDTSPTLASPAPVPPASTPEERERAELERLRGENLIRDRVQSEVDRAFSRVTTLLNTLLFLLILFPIVAGVGFWLLRRSIIYQITEETQHLLDQLRDKFEKQLAAELNAELKGQTQALKQEIAALKSENVTQITTLIAEAQNLLEELRQQKDILQQEIDRIRYELYSQPEGFVEQDVEPHNYEDISDLLGIASDETSEDVAQESESEPPPVLDANDYLHQGNVFFSEGRYSDANNAYSEAIKIERDFPEARYQNARCYAQRGKVNLAIGNLQWAIDLDNKYKQMAKTDSAFDSLREDEQFKKMIDDS